MIFISDVSAEEAVEGTEDELDFSSGDLEDDDEPPGFDLLAIGVKPRGGSPALNCKKTPNSSSKSAVPPKKESLPSRTRRRRVTKYGLLFASGDQLYQNTPGPSTTNLPR